MSDTRGTMIPTLPTEDPRPTERQSRLLTARGTYTYDHERLSPLPLAARVPTSDGPAAAWFGELAKLLVMVRANVWRVGRGIEASRANDLDLKRVAEAVAADSPGAAKNAFKEIVDLAANGFVKGRPSGRKDYAALFQSLDLPDNASTYHWDASFARMRVAGPNPMVIRRLAARDDRFPVTDAHLRAVLGDGDSLEAAAKEGRLYLADYTSLEGLKLGVHVDLDQSVVANASTRSSPKHLATPLALFAVPAARGQAASGARALRPVAIQLGPRPGPDTPIFTPGDGWGWTIAKSLVQTADGHFHQVAAHFAGTHMVVEPFVIATLRQLDRSHPLRVLLEPHFEGTLYINDAAETMLLADKGGVDLLMSSTIAESRALSGKVVQAWVFDASAPPDALRLRGVLDPEALPDFPYRDDGLLVWDAIRKWVGTYLRVYYRGDADVLADTELQAWAREVRADDGGRMKSFAPTGRVESLEYLASAAALVIFTASAQHAAVNFPQRELMSYTPAMPLAAYHPAPTSKEGLSAQDYLDLLPPLDMAHMQRDLGTLLGGLRHTRLGQYDKGTFTDPRVSAPLAAFQGRLAEIEKIIQERNTARPAYGFLRPSLIPQSINI
jgi:arachidonate 15-lipoxygenase